MGGFAEAIQGNGMAENTLIDVSNCHLRPYPG